MYYGERLNSYTHLAGVIFAVMGSAVLIVIGALTADPWKIVSFSIYGATLVLMFGASTLYHSTRGSVKRIFRKLDYNAIYLLIAGSYTPFSLVTLRGAWGWSLFGVVWGLAALGMLQESFNGKESRMVSLIIYVLMGWVAIIATIPLARALSWVGFALVAAGGVIYTVGIVFYLFDEKYKHWHGIWHLFVVAGSAVHYAAVLLFVA